MNSKSGRSAPVSSRRYFQASSFLAAKPSAARRNISRRTWGLVFDHAGNALAQDAMAASASVSDAAELL